MHAEWRKILGGMDDITSMYFKTKYPKGRLHLGEPLPPYSGFQVRCCTMCHEPKIELYFFKHNFPTKSGIFHNYMLTLCLCTCFDVALFVVYIVGVMLLC